MNLFVCKLLTLSIMDLQTTLPESSRLFRTFCYGWIQCICFTPPPQELFLDTKNILFRCIWTITPKIFRLFFCGCPCKLFAMKKLCFGVYLWVENSFDIVIGYGSVKLPTHRGLINKFKINNRKYTF